MSAFHVQLPSRCIPKYFASAYHGTFVPILLASYWSLLSNPSHDSRSRFSAGPRRSVQSAHIRAQNMPSPGTHEPASWRPGFRLLSLLPHPSPPHVCDSLTWPLSLTRRFSDQRTLTLFPCLFPRPAKLLLFLYPISSFGGRAIAQRFPSFYGGAKFVAPYFQHEHIRAVTAFRSLLTLSIFVTAQYEVTFIQGIERFYINAGLCSRLFLNLCNYSENAVSQLNGRRRDHRQV
jgi:hypothetical protein